MTREPSLREQILAASSELEIAGLLGAGLQFEYATAHTRGRWRAAARKRRAQLMKGAK